MPWSTPLSNIYVTSNSSYSLDRTTLLTLSLSSRNNDIHIMMCHETLDVPWCDRVKKLKLCGACGQASGV